ncbi:MAG: bifunctional nuclease family protein [Flavobacteriales bacterium]|nr:bifunctional nuclease family protein [Flavobacteriales bacterium]
MNKIPLDIIGLSYSQTQTGAYALVLGEQGGSRRLPIIIGGFEAQSIAVHLENMKPTRPLTHDLFVKLTESFHIQVKEVVIYNLLEGVFYAKLICDDGIREVEIDSRTSDAVALAVRYGCPVYTYEFILEAAGIRMEDEPPSEEHVEEKTTSSRKKEPLSLTEMSIEELEKSLKEAIDNEAYELASKIRDEINRRKS